jgi:Protein of unknown function (DUF3039)
VPLVAVVTSIRVEVGSAQRPRQLRGALRFSFGAVGILWRALAGEVRGDATEGTSRGLASPTAFHGPHPRPVTTLMDMSVQAETEVVVRSTTEIDEGDHERFTHIVLEGYTKKSGKFVALDNSVVEGMVNATPVRALCGKVWVPGRDPQKYPVCPTCKEIAEKMGWSLPGG